MNAAQFSKDGKLLSPEVLMDIFASGGSRLASLSGVLCRNGFGINVMQLSPKLGSSPMVAPTV